MASRWLGAAVILFVAVKVLFPPVGGNYLPFILAEAVIGGLLICGYRRVGSILLIMGACGGLLSFALLGWPKSQGCGCFPGGALDGLGQMLAKNRHTVLLIIGLLASLNLLGGEQCDRRSRGG